MFWCCCHTKGAQVTQSLKLAPSSSLATLAARRIRDAITNGEFAFGEMIPEESLAQAMGISRTPVREALNELQRMGLVVIRPQRGSYVFEPTEADIAAICDYRLMLECHAAHLAYTHDKDKAHSALADALTAMEEARRINNRVAYGLADTRFHEVLFHHCANPYLRAAYDLVSAKIAALRAQLTAPFDALRVQSFDEHRRFLDLFDAGDFVHFESLMREHVDRTREVYTLAWNSRPQTTPPQTRRRAPA